MTSRRLAFFLRLVDLEDEMDSERTCGKGLAENSQLPARMSKVLSAMTDNLELHMGAHDMPKAESHGAGC